MDAIDNRIDMERALDTLTRKQRRALILCIIEGYTQVEAAGIMGVSQQTVQDHLRAAIGKARAYCDGTL